MSSLNAQIVQRLAQTYLESGGNPKGLPSFLQESLSFDTSVKKSKSGANDVYAITFGQESVKITINNTTNEDEDTEGSNY
jgi:hypothetical protein